MHKFNLTDIFNNRLTIEGGNTLTIYPADAGFMATGFTLGWQEAKSLSDYLKDCSEYLHLSEVIERLKAAYPDMLIWQLPTPLLIDAYHARDNAVQLVTDGVVQEIVKLVQQELANEGASNAAE